MHTCGSYITHGTRVCNLYQDVSSSAGLLVAQQMMDVNAPRRTAPPAPPAHLAEEVSFDCQPEDYTCEHKLQGGQKPKYKSMYQGETVERKGLDALYQHLGSTGFALSRRALNLVYKHLCAHIQHFIVTSCPTQANRYLGVQCKCCGFAFIGLYDRYKTEEFVRETLVYALLEYFGLEIPREESTCHVKWRDQQQKSLEPPTPPPPRPGT